MAAGRTLKRRRQGRGFSGSSAATPRTTPLRRWPALLGLLALWTASSGGSPLPTAEAPSARVLPASSAQARKFWVVLADKGPDFPPPSVAGDRGVADPHPRARALAYENAPLYEPYLTCLVEAGFRTDIRLKWQNRVSGYAEQEKLAALHRCPGVASIAPLPRKHRFARSPGIPEPAPPLPKAGAQPVERFDGHFRLLGLADLQDTLAAKGARPGQGLRIAVIDADFHLGHQGFDPLFSEGRIADQWDFVDDDAESVDRQFNDSHGGWVLSLLALTREGREVGAVPAAEYLLYRSEDESQEVYAEEDYVAAAVERAVDAGAHIINISLGYRTEYSDSSPNIPYEQFDGRTRPSSLAVLGAARRNVLVAVSMGNEGAEISGTPSVSAPGDADSILAVGIANEDGNRCGFSSTGPAADGRVKPDLSTWGAEAGCRVPMADTRSVDGYRTATGTSFASPVAAGAAALLRQIHPTLTAEEIRQALLRTSSQYDAPDGQIGYGLMQARDALGFLAGRPRDTLIFRAKKPVRFSAFFDRALPGLALQPEIGLDLSRTRLFTADGRRRPNVWKADTLTVQGAGGIYFGEIPLSKP